MKTTPDIGSGPPRQTNQDRQLAKPLLLQDSQFSAASAEVLFITKATPDSGSSPPRLTHQDRKEDCSGWCRGPVHHSE